MLRCPCAGGELRNFCGFALMQNFTGSSRAGLGWTGKEREGSSSKPLPRSEVTEPAGRRLVVSRSDAIAM